MRVSSTHVAASYLALIAVYEKRIIRRVEHDAKSGGHDALWSRDERILVWLDADLKVNDAVFVDKVVVRITVRLGDEGAERKDEHCFAGSEKVGGRHTGWT